MDMVDMIEFPLVNRHPNFRLRMSFREVGLIDQRAVQAVLGENIQDSLTDYESEIVVLAYPKDRVDNCEVDRLLSPPEQAEIETAAEQVVLPENWAELMQKRFGKPPTDKDRRASQMATARKRLEAERSFLTDLPDSTKRALRTNATQLFFINSESPADEWPSQRQHLPMQEVVRIGIKGEIGLPRNRLLRLTGSKKDHLCIMQERSRKKLGMVIAMPITFFHSVQETKILLTASFMTDLRGMYCTDASESE